MTRLVSPRIVNTLTPRDVDSDLQREYFTKRFMTVLANQLKRIEDSTAREALERLGIIPDPADALQGVIGVEVAACDEAIREQKLRTEAAIRRADSEERLPQWAGKTVEQLLTSVTRGGDPLDMIVNAARVLKSSALGREREAMREASIQTRRGERHREADNIERQLSPPSAGRVLLDAARQMLGLRPTRPLLVAETPNGLVDLRPGMRDAAMLDHLDSSIDPADPAAPLSAAQQARRDFRALVSLCRDVQNAQANRLHVIHTLDQASTGDTRAMRAVSAVARRAERSAA